MLISGALVLQAAFLVAALIKMAKYNPHSQNDEGAVSTRRHGEILNTTQIKCCGGEASAREEDPHLPAQTRSPPPLLKH